MSPAAKAKTKNLLKIGYAQLWRKIYFIRNKSYLIWHKAWLGIFTCLFLSAIPISYLSIYKFSLITPDYFSDLVNVLQDYFIALGATLIGAGAIAFSFIGQPPF